MWATNNRKFVLWISLAALALAAMPFVANSYVLTILTFANIYAVAAASWDLLSGYAGQLSFGQVAFYGIGAYSVGLVNKYFAGQPGLSWMSNPFLAIGIGALAAVLVSLVIGLAAVRLHGPHLAIVTFMVGMILQELVIIEYPITGGQFGLRGGSVFSDPAWIYWTSLVLIIGSVGIMMYVVNSRYGNYFRCIRDDEIAAQSIGINPTKYKLLAFVISAALCSVSGGFYTAAFGIVNTDAFGYNYNLLWIEMSVIGGAGTILGAVLGSYFIELIVELLRVSPVFSLVGFSVAFLLVIRFFPRGILSLLKRLIAARQHD